MPSDWFRLPETGDGTTADPTRPNWQTEVAVADTTGVP